MISSLDSSSTFVKIPNFSNSFTALSVVKVPAASTMDLMLGRPRLAASFTQSSE